MPCVNTGDSERQVAVAYMYESRFLQQRLHFFLVRESPDGLDQVGVCLRGLGHPGAEARDNGVGKCIVKGPDDGPWAGEL